MSEPPDRLRVSIVIPLLNEEMMVPLLFEAMRSFFRARPGTEWELLLVDDGSRDRTVDLVRAQPALPVPVRLIRFSRNFGHQCALAAGLQRASGEAVVCMDADLQDPPEVVDAFVEKFREGYDVVYAIRETRQGSLIKRAAYAVFYRVFQRVAEIPVPLDSGDFGLMSHRVARLVASMPERDILLRGLRSWVGYRQIGVPCHRPERAAGQAKYTFRKLMRLATSAFFGFSRLPLRFATGTGVVAMVVGGCYGTYSLVSKWWGHAPWGWTSIILILLILGGAQLVAIGILGEYVARIYEQTRGRPLYVVAGEEEIAAEGSAR